METLEDELFIYNFTEGRIFKKWKHIIKETGLSKNGENGYYTILIYSKKKLLHRVLYEKYHNTIIPEGLLIDHINKIKTDNRIENLRLVSKTQNAQNTSKRNNNTSGHKNITYYRNRSKWIVQIVVDCKNIYYGCFTNLEDAVKRRDEVLLELNLQGHIFST